MWRYFYEYDYRAVESNTTEYGGGNDSHSLTQTSAAEFFWVFLDKLWFCWKWPREFRGIRVDRKLNLKCIRFYDHIGVQARALLLRDTISYCGNRNGVWRRKHQCYITAAAEREALQHQPVPVEDHQKEWRKKWKLCSIKLCVTSYWTLPTLNTKQHNSDLVLPVTYGCLHLEHNQVLVSLHP